MNFSALFIVLAAGFGVSFLILDVSRVIARNRWPASDALMRANFQPFAIFLALFAGPALFIQAIWRMRTSSGLSGMDGFLALAISVGWAACYGTVVMQGARFFGLSVY